MKCLLDSSFIISCIRARIDFLEQLKEQGFEAVLPREVMQEMKDLKKKNKTSHDSRVAIDVALNMFEKNKIKKISFGEGNVDDYLKRKGNEGYYIATLDREIKLAVPKRIVIFKAQGKIGVE